MIDDFTKQCLQANLPSISMDLIELSNRAFSVNNGNIPKWESAISQIIQNPAGTITYDKPYLKITTDQDHVCDLTSAFKQLMPWRKGPYQINDFRLDSEWRGDMKWDRIAPHIQSLQNKVVLDVGAGNGYFSYLMSLSGAKITLGLEPFLLFNYQSKAIRSLIKNSLNTCLLPLRLEQIPNQALFDTVFSMGVLYHQKDHLLHLRELKSVLKDSGELILETLIIDQTHGDYLIPEDRYAKMRNVWCLPSVSTLRSWLQQVGFNKIDLIDITKTTPEEQRATHWIGENTQSLKDFLDPNDDSLTIEGLPAPLRATLICKP